MSRFAALALLVGTTMLTVASTTLPATAAVPSTERPSPGGDSAAKPLTKQSSPGDDTAGETRLPAGRFGTVTVYIPEETPRSVAIFLSGDGGWHRGVINMAKSLEDLGAVVIGVDTTHYLRELHNLTASGAASCQSLAGDLEDLSHRIQKEIGMSEYHVPVLVGYSSGATVVYATLVQSPPGTFAGAMSLGFCPDQDFGGAALCAGAGLHYTQSKRNDWIFAPATQLKQPWIALQGQQDQVCAAPAVDRFGAQVDGSQIIKLPEVGHGFGVTRHWLPQFRSAYIGIVDKVNAAKALRPAAIGDLPVNEVRAASQSDEFALLLTGDGGWAGLDQELASRLAAAGVSTVGLNSLKYFWTERSPDEVARDVARVMRHYLSTWNKSRVLLVGYSFGADVLPFVINRLPADLHDRVATVSLLGIDSNASFEIRVADWIGADDSGSPTRPELADVRTTPVLCLYGVGEQDSICPQLHDPRVTSEAVGKGHHFSGEYSLLADKILAFAQNENNAKP